MADPARIVFNGDTERLKVLIACAERELSLRVRVYPRFVERGGMTQAKADAEIALMGEIVTLLKSLATPPPEVQPSLFGGSR